MKMKTQVNIWYCDACGKKLEPWIKYVQQSGNLLEVCDDCFNTIKLLEKLGIRPPNRVSCDGCHKTFELNAEEDHARIMDELDSKGLYDRFMIVLYCEDCRHKEEGLPWDKQKYTQGSNRLSKLTHMRSRDTKT